MKSLTSLALTVVLLASPTLVDAQAITGSVRDQASGNPIESAQVFLEGLNLGALTGANGEYLLLNVPVGTHTLTVEFLGYRAESVSVTVGAGQAVEQNVFLGQQPLQLDEIVVTGTAAASRVREIGNSVAVLDAQVAFRFRFRTCLTLAATKRSKVSLRWFAISPTASVVRRHLPRQQHCCKRRSRPCPRASASTTPISSSSPSTSKSSISWTFRPVSSAWECPMRKSPVSRGGRERAGRTTV